ncbi:MAG: type II toxin-antitoxin system Phd/YefM family antitoxin [Octadecabacter sp.]
MQLTLSAARTRMSELVTKVQDPNECVVLTRHGVPVAAVVSMANLHRIWQMEHEEERGEIKHPLNKFPHVVGSPLGRLVRGLNGRMVTRREAALQVRTMQKTRAEERRILEAGGVEGVEGGELRLENDPVDRSSNSRAEPRRWFRLWGRP